MKKFSQVVKQFGQRKFLAMLKIGSATFLYTSCVTPYYDPYYVSASRQQENVYYAPAALNAPLLSNKNDGSATMTGSFSNAHSAFELQGAFNPGNHFGLLMNYTTGRQGDYDGHFKRFELGAGYYTSFASKGHLELYGGFGSGKINNNHYTGTSHIKQQFYFIQPAVGLFNEKKTFKVAFVSKFSGVNFNVQDTLFDTDRENLSAAQIKSLYNEPFHLYWEPGVVMKFGWKNFMFLMSYSAAADLTNSDLFRAKSNFSLGLNFGFNTSKKRTLE